ncbi:hypothetical protein [Mycobacterium sp.]|uniref:hypothetical protein n=1 Tax=Mycobacterium sp. TaxID=1785 RepID=UPI003C70AB98
MLTPNLVLNTSTEAVDNDEARERLVSPAPVQIIEQPAPVLITEQEVVFGTAAAVRPQPSTLRRWAEATRVLLASMERALVVSPHDDRQKRRDYPKNYAFLERASMARAMERL